MLQPRQRARRPRRRRAPMLRRPVSYVLDRRAAALRAVPVKHGIRVLDGAHLVVHRLVPVQRHLRHRLPERDLVEDAHRERVGKDELRV